MMNSTRATDPDFFNGIEMGVGTWAWGDRLFWGYGDDYNEDQVEEAFTQAIAGHMILFDTAEVYGQGKSEVILGRLLKKTDRPVKVADKIMPYPWRIFKGSLRNALKESLHRLDREKLDLYQMHYPGIMVSVTRWMNQMADVLEEGLISAIGVSNFNLDQTITANETLKKRGFKLTSNQVEYNLLERRVESSGLVEYCHREGIKIIAYSPLAMGVLTGKYSSGNPPRGVRASRYSSALLDRIQPLLRTMIRIGNERDGKTAGQVALNWIMRKNAVPIPGAKNVNQMEQNLGALGWQLDDDEMALLDEISSQVMVKAETSRS